MDEQTQLDLTVKAERYDRIVRCQDKVERLIEEVKLLSAKLKTVQGKLKEAQWDLCLAMSPVRKGVRG